MRQTEAFNPPYDSPIEETLAWNLSKYLDEPVVLDKQVEVVTPFATFYLDLVVRLPGGRVIAFECDGKEYHTDPFRDHCRDALIFCYGGAKAIYRFRGQDLYYSVNDCLYVVARKDPAIFSDRGHRHIELLASEETKAAVGADPSECPHGYEHNGVVTVFTRDEDRDREYSVVVGRRSADTFRRGAVADFLKYILSNPAPFSSAYQAYNALRTKAW